MVYFKLELRKARQRQWLRLQGMKDGNVRRKRKKQGKNGEPS